MPNELEEALDTIRRFLDDAGDVWEWGDFLTEPPDDPAVLELRGFCQSLVVDYPPTDPTQYCSAQGMRVLEIVWSRLKALAAPTSEATRAALLAVAEK